VSQANKFAAQKCTQHGLDHLLQKNHLKPIANIKHLSNAKTQVIKASENSPSILLIKYQNTIKAYVNNCPHQNVPLDEAYKIDVNPFEKTLKCSIHDAFFKVENGECIEGPCRNESLVKVDIDIDTKGDIYLNGC